MKKLLLLCVIACLASHLAFAADDDDENHAADRIEGRCYRARGDPGCS